MSQSPNIDRLIRLMETVGHGELRIIVQNGIPVRAELVVKSVKLDSPEEFEDRFRLISL